MIWIFLFAYICLINVHINVALEIMIIIEKCCSCLSSFYQIWKCNKKNLIPIFGNQLWTVALNKKIESGKKKKVDITCSIFKQVFIDFWRVWTIRIGERNFPSISVTRLLQIKNLKWIETCISYKVFYKVVIAYNKSNAWSTNACLSGAIFLLKFFI